MKSRLTAISRAQLHIALGLTAVLVIALLFIFVIHPLRVREMAIRSQIKKQVEKNTLALGNVRRITELRQETARLKEALAVETNRFVLRPVLGSFPVQRDIYRMAADTAFRIAAMKEVGKKPTPTELKPVAQAASKGRPKSAIKSKLKPPAFDRYVVEIIGDGSFFDVCTLIEILAEENPYCGVTDLTISGVSSSPERHRVTMVLEWPVLADPPVVAGKTAANR